MLKLASRRACSISRASSGTIEAIGLIAPTMRIVGAVSLQEMLGHGSLGMVRHYAKVAQVDVEQAHRKASPADNWRL